MTSVPLNESVAVILDGLGNGTVSIGPLTAREVWYPQTVHISCAAPVTNESICKVYVGDYLGDGTFRDGTYSGSSGDSSDRVSADEIKIGIRVWAEWTGGDPGVRATMIVTGRREI